MGKIKDISTEKSRPSVGYGKYDFDTICAGIFFMISNPGHIGKLHKFLDADYFYVGDESPQSQGLRVLVKILHDMRLDKAVGITGINPVSFDSFVKCTSDTEANQAARELFKAMLSNPKIHEKSTDRTCQKIFLDYLKVIQIVKWSETFMPKYKTGDMAGATKEVKDLMGGLNQVQFYDVTEAIDTTTLDLSGLRDLMSVALGSTGDIFLIGNDELDHAIGGFERRALHLFIGATNSGKSQMTHHLIRRSVAQNMTVHVTFVEDRPKSVYRRLYAALTGIPVNTLKYQWGTLTDEQKASIEKAKETVARFVKVDFGYGDGLDTIHQRKIEYDMERLAKGMKPYDVDIIDYTGHISESAMGDKMYEKYRNAFAARKNFALINDKIVFDFAQLNRMGFQKKQDGIAVNHGDLAGGFDLAQVCDNIIAINRSPAEEKNCTARLTPTKVKDGEVRPNGYKVGTQFECARWIMNTEDAGTFANTTPAPIPEVELKVAI